MAPTTEYVDLDGRRWKLATLDASERKLLRQLQSIHSRPPDWYEFENDWIKKLTTFYRERGLPTTAIIKRPLYEILTDLSDRLALAQGLMSIESDYRDDLRILIADRFKSNRHFCKATGLSEDMLSHVLAGRKDLSIEALTKADRKST